MTKKNHLKNDKIERFTLSFLNDEHHFQILSPGKRKLIRPQNMNEWKQLLLSLYLCILEGKKLELTFSNFLTNKKLELDFANFFNHGNLTRLSSNLSFCTSV